MKWFYILPALLTLTAAAGPDELVYGTDARDSSGRPVRIIAGIRADGSGRREFLHPDFVGENFWPGYRGSGPVQFDTPDVSPAGKQILFSNTYNVFAMNWNGGPVFALTRFTREKYQPRWSPDGKRILFVSDRNSNCELYVMNADGTNLRNISWNRSANLSPCWSPDGKAVAFISDRDGKFELYVSDDRGIRQRKILSLPHAVREPDWGRNGRILFSTASDDGKSVIMSVLPDGSGLRTEFETAEWSGHPAWSPDGNRIAYSSTREGQADIWIFDLKTGKHRNVTKSPATQDYFPRWVPIQRPECRPQTWQLDRTALSEAKLSDAGRLDARPVKDCPALIPQKSLPRPRMLFTAADLPAIRARLTREPYKTFWQRFLKKCDVWLNDPGIAASLDRIPGDPLRKRYDIPAFAELYYRENWLDALFSLAFARQITGKAEYGRRAMEILTGAADRYRRSHGVMHSDYRTACAYDWLYDLIPETERPGLNMLLKNSLAAKQQTCLHHAVGIYGTSPGSGNYAIYFAASLGPMGFALQGEPGIPDDFRETAERLALITLNTWIAPEGDAQEGFSYFQHPAGELMPFLISLRRNGQGAELLDSNLKKVFSWLALSAGKGGSETPALGDSDYLAMRLPAGLLALYPDHPLLQKIWNRVPRPVSELTTVQGLLWWEPSQVREPQWGPMPDAALFPHTGYAVLRTGGKFADAVMTVSAPKQSGHAHLEYGAVTLTANGLRLLADPGQAVPMCEYHSQILVDGLGRERSSLVRPMLGEIRRDGLTVSVPVDFTEAFALSYFGAPGYSGIPCGRPGLKSGRRIVTMVKATDGVPPYFLISDRIRTGQNCRYDQLFTADQGMQVTAEKDGSLRIAESIREPVYQASSREDLAEWSFSQPFKGEWFVHVYARSAAPVELEVNGKTFRLTFQQPPSRPDTWQWRPLQLNRKVFRIALDKGPGRIRLKSTARIYALGLSMKRNNLCGRGPVVTNDVLTLKVADARRTGRGWKTIPPETTCLHLVPLAGKTRAGVRERIFNTRFHGQLKVVLPQAFFTQEGKEAEFLTLAYPAGAEAEQPTVRGGKLHWKSCTDEITVEHDQIKVRRIRK